MPVVDYYRQHGKVVEVSRYRIYLDPPDDEGRLVSIRRCGLPECSSRHQPTTAQCVPFIARSYPLGQRHRHPNLLRYHIGQLTNRDGRGNDAYRDM